MDGEQSPGALFDKDNLVNCYISTNLSPAILRSLYNENNEHRFHIIINSVLDEFISFVEIELFLSEKVTYTDKQLLTTQLSYRNKWYN